MGDSTVAERERAAMADLFEQVGPDRPTLCEGWDTDDLLTHLVVRERRMDTALWHAIPPLRGWAKDVARSYHRRPWAERIRMLREGPQRFNPVSLPPVDSAVNTGEFFIHHEDIRRGEPGWTVRTVDEETRQALVKQIKNPISKLMLKKLGVGVRVVLPGDNAFELISGDPAITLTGEPGEIVLWISGRQRASRAEVSGSPEALAKLERAGG